MKLRQTLHVHSPRQTLPLYSLPRFLLILSFLTFTFTRSNLTSWYNYSGTLNKSWQIQVSTQKCIQFAHSHFSSLHTILSALQLLMNYFNFSRRTVSSSEQLFRLLTKKWTAICEALFSSRRTNYFGKLINRQKQTDTWAVSNWKFTARLEPLFLKKNIEYFCTNNFIYLHYDLQLASFLQRLCVY